MILINFPGRQLVFETPTAVLTTNLLAEVPDIIRSAEAAACKGMFVVGFVTYEAAPAFDAALKVRPGTRMPLCWFACFDSIGRAIQATQRSSSSRWSIATDRETFRQHVGTIREEIARGRTYQTNITTRFHADAPTDPLALYDSMVRAQGAGYHAWIDTGDFVIACASPELFFELDGRAIRTKPMKGTRPRGRFAAEDEQLARELFESEKDRAENLMIVDLLRNDLGRVAKFKTVQVPSLYDVERYRTVHQMTSTVTATLRDDVRLVDVFRALFPCGSVTGAPKVSTMQLIAELEDAPREVYCGAIGMIEPGGARAVFNVPIRTVWIDKMSNRATYGAGAGITFDSNADAEFDEVVAKAAVLTESWPEFELLETMRIEDGAIVRLDRHIARLLESARYFGFDASESAIREQLEGLKSDPPARIRLLVNARGTVRSEVLPLEATPALPAVTIAASPVSSLDRFLFHKTTHRRVYDRYHTADFWDVLLWNERDEITEFTRGNVVVEIGGELLTPSRECGLLNGTFRDELLEAGIIGEAVIRKDDLIKATRIWFINSLREWVLCDLHAEFLP